MARENGDEQGAPAKAARPPATRTRSAARAAAAATDFGSSVKVPDAIDIQRARRILDELRAASANSAAPSSNSDYLERLLPRD